MGSAQYDEIVTAYNEVYDDLDNLPSGQLEEANLHAAVKDHITNKRVLDLGCGSGHHSRRFLAGGARSVVGVDISAGMIEEAKARAAELKIDEGTLSYHVGDASRSLDLSALGAPFDLVAGTWLLNYASNRKEMEGMWKTVAANLRPGGLFIGLTIPPPLGDKYELDRAFANEWASLGNAGHVIREVEDGFEAHIVLGMPGDTKRVEFTNFHLRHEAFEESSKAAGMSGSLEWLPFVLPRSLVESRPVGYWNGAVLNPHFRICRIVR